ncbi:MAG TPA: hypothetical protein VF148_12230 [Acidimicrobiia bacterium]
MNVRRNIDGVSVGALAAGMLVGALTGFAIWVATAIFVFLPVFLGNGVVLGLILQQAADRRDG